MPRVLICFLPANSSLLEDHWLNRAAASYAPRPSDGMRPPMVHTELFFPSNVAAVGGAGVAGAAGDEVFGQSCGIHFGGKVFLSPKNFSKKEWQFRSYDCSEVQYDRMYNFCREQVGGSFNRVGYFSPCNPSRWFRKSNTAQQSWYCSELVAHAMLEGGLLAEKDVSVAGSHPEALYARCLEGSSYADCGRNLTYTKLVL